MRLRRWGRAVELCHREPSSAICFKNGTGRGKLVVTPYPGGNQSALYAADARIGDYTLMCIADMIAEDILHA